MRWFGRALMLCVFLALTWGVGDGFHPRSDRYAFALGSWPLWRGDPAHSGHQPLSSHLAQPRVTWRLPLGGRVRPESVLVCPFSSPVGGATLFVSTPGLLRRYAIETGSLLWSVRFAVELDLVDCADFLGAGGLQVVATTSGLSGGRVVIVNAGDGSLVWESPSTSGHVGALAAVPVTGADVELLWAPAGTSTVRLYRFADGFARSTLVWEALLPDYVSDPYSYSQIAVADLDGDHNREVVIAGGRASVTVLVLDARTGRERARKSLGDAVAGVEAGGAQQLLYLVPSRGRNPGRIVVVASHQQSASYMFQGILSLSPDLSSFTLLDAHPEGLEYVEGSVAHTADGVLREMFVSRPSGPSAIHELLSLDPGRLTVLKSIPGVRLTAVLPGPSAAGRTLVLAHDPSVNDGSEVLSVYTPAAAATPTPWATRGRVATISSPSLLDPFQDNNGVAAGAVDANGDGVDDVLLWSGDGALVAVDSTYGRPLARFSAGPGAGPSLLGVQKAHAPGASRVVLGTRDGNIVLLDGFLRRVAEVPVGGYFRNPSGNGHGTEVAAVGDLDGDGTNEIVAIDSRNRIVRFEGKPGTAPVRKVLWDDPTQQELVLLPASGRFHVVARHATPSGPGLALLDASGGVLWSRVPEGPGMLYDRPLGLNYGRFNAASGFDLVFSIAPHGQFPRETFAVNGRSGQTLWTSKVGTYWDATFATADLDEDGIDDVFLNYHVTKGIVLDGATGKDLSPGTVLPNYGPLGAIDYNGSPIVGGRAEEGGRYVLNGQDNAHLALLKVPFVKDGPSIKPTVAWSAPYARIDDQRSSMPALFRGRDGTWLIGEASSSGLVGCRRAADGAVLWERWVRDGQLVDGITNVPLSSVLANDVDGNGEVDFVVGGYDGFLYALRSGSGDLVWALNLGLPVGDPIAGDIDSDGHSEILVPTADGHLNVVDSGP